MVRGEGQEGCAVTSGCSIPLCCRPPSHHIPPHASPNPRTLSPRPHPEQVRWEDSRTSVEMRAKEVEALLTDVFANEHWVPKKIRAAQLVGGAADRAASVVFKL